MNSRDEERVAELERKMATVWAHLFPPPPEPEPDTEPAAEPEFEE